MKNANIRHYAELMVNGNKEKTVKDTVVKVLKVLYYLVAIGAILTCLTNMMGSYVHMLELEYEGMDTADSLGLYNECRTYLITMIVCVFALVANFFLLRYKLCIPFMLVGCIECVVIFTTFYGVSNLNSFNTGASGMFWVLAIPAMLVALISVVLGVMIFVSYRMQIPKAYDKITSELYKVHSKDGEVKLSLEDFDKIMDNYKGEELFPIDRPLKKSQRRRKEKQELEMAQAKTEETEE